MCSLYPFALFIILIALPSLNLGKCPTAMVPSRKTCSQCLDANCENCKYIRQQCTTCKSRYYINKYGTCSACPQNCVLCDEFHCIECKGYKNEEDGKCLPCTIGCQECNKDGCYVCLSGYTLNEETRDCIPCTTGCSTCALPQEITNPNNIYIYMTAVTPICTACSQYYGLIDGKCEECRTPCVSCDGDIKNCTECMEGYVLSADGDACLDCPHGCAKCSLDKRDECKKCWDLGFYLYGGQCHSCIDDCYVCEYGDRCQKCRSNYMKEVHSNSITPNKPNPDGAACVKRCSGLSFVNYDGFQFCLTEYTCPKGSVRGREDNCIGCPKLCGNCDLEGCIECEEGNFLNVVGSQYDPNFPIRSDSCASQCLTLYYENICFLGACPGNHPPNSEGECLCPPNCLECDGVSCLECKEGFLQLIMADDYNNKGGINILAVICTDSCWEKYGGRTYHQYCFKDHCPWSLYTSGKECKGTNDFGIMDQNMVGTLTVLMLAIII